MTHLILREYGWYFRIKVPGDITDKVKKTEIRISLRTWNLKLAKHRAKALGGLIWGLFERIRMKELDQDDIMDILNVYKDLALGMFEGGNLKAEIGRPPDAVDVYGDILTRIKRLEFEQASGRSKFVESGLDDVLHGLEYPPVSKKNVWYQELLRQALELTIKTLGENLERLGSEYPRLELDKRFGVSAGKRVSSPSLKAVWERFKKDKINSKRWNRNSVRRFDQMADLLLKHVGDISVAGITKEMMQNYRVVLDESGRDPSTVRGYLQLAKALLDFARDNDFISENPVLTGMIPPKKRREREQREIYSEEDLAKLFNPDVYRKWATGKPSRFWIPLLGLFTGARLEELASLHSKDIITKDDIVCLDINDEGERSVKNENAIRVVPVHPFVIECGFLEYVQSLGSSEGQLFPELRKLHYKFGHKFSATWSKYQKKKVGITGKKSFHSFRHTLTDHLYKKMVNENVIEELNGRAGRSETSRRYAKGHRVKTLYEEAVLKITLGKSLVNLRG